MAKACWIVTIVIAVNAAVLGSLYLWDREKFFGWLVTFDPPILHIIHYNDEYDIMKSPSWVEKVLEKKRSETITVFSGDIMSPSILAASLKGSQFRKMIEMVGMDYAVPGNHEVDFGAAEFLKFTKDTTFKTKWLVANMHYLDDTFGPGQTGKPIGEIEEWTVREQQGLKIGFFGLVDEAWMNNFPKTPIPEREHFKYTPFQDVARRVSQQLRSQGCDLVFVITHMSTAHDRELLLDPEVKVDIVFGGHDHVYYLQRYGSKLLLKSGSDFDQFSTLSLQFKNSISRDETKIEYLEVKMGPDSAQVTEGTKAPETTPPKTPETTPPKTPETTSPKTPEATPPKTPEATPPKTRVLEEMEGQDPAETEEAMEELEEGDPDDKKSPPPQLDDSEEELSNFKINKWKHYQYQYDEMESISGDKTFVFSLLQSQGKFKYLEVRVEMITINFERDPPNQEIKDHINRDIYPLIREYMTHVMQISDRMDAREITIMSRESEVGDLVADILRTDHKADISIINSGSIKSEAFFRPKFFFVQKDIRKMFSRDSKMFKVELSGADVLKVMEAFFTKLPKPDGDFICFGGIQMKVDPNQPEMHRIVDGSVMMGDEPFDTELVYNVVILDFLWGLATKTLKLPVTDQKQFKAATDELKRPIDSLQVFLDLPQNPEFQREFNFFKKIFPTITIDELIALEKIGQEKTINAFSEEEVGFTPERPVLSQATSALIRRLKFYSLAESISEEKEMPVFVVRPKKDNRLVLVPVQQPAAPGVVV